MYPLKVVSFGMRDKRYSSWRVLSCCALWMIAIHIFFVRVKFEACRQSHLEKSGCVDEGHCGLLGVEKGDFCFELELFFLQSCLWGCPVLELIAG